MILKTRLCRNSFLLNKILTLEIEYCVGISLFVFVCFFTCFYLFALFWLSPTEFSHFNTNMIFQQHFSLTKHVRTPEFLPQFLLLRYFPVSRKYPQAMNYFRNFESCIHKRFFVK